MKRITVKAFVVNPSENYGIFCHFGGYDKGFYGITKLFMSFCFLYDYQKYISLDLLNQIINM